MLVAAPVPAITSAAMDKKQETPDEGITRYPGKVLGFDTETTGISPASDHILTMAIVEHAADGTETVTSWVINPGDDIEIPEASVEVHGLTREFITEHGVPPAQALGELLEILKQASRDNTPVVGHNVSFDLTMLLANLRRAGVAQELPWFPVLDTIVLDRQAEKYRRGSRTLTALSEHYGVTLDDAHDAAADARASVEVLHEIARRYPTLVRVPLPELHARQVDWRREQQESLQAYLRRVKNDDTIVVEAEWPIQTSVLDDTPAA